jgi:hypothetical protein
MKTKTEKLLAVMNVLAWITFIGLMIKAGAILISYGVSVVNPEGAKNLYKGTNLYALRQFNFLHYTSNVSFMIAVLLSEAYIAFLVIKVLSKIKMANPFTLEVSNILERLSYTMLGTWIVAMLYNGHTKWLLKKLPGLAVNLISGEFIFLAGVVFVIAQIFKKGIEIQSENELTV